MGRSKYCTATYDDASVLSLVRFTKTKTASSSALQEKILEVENICDSSIKCLSVQPLQTNSAKDFISISMKKWLQGNGIIQQNSSVYSPESNGKGERLN